MARLGCHLPNIGELAGSVGMARMAGVAEEAGAHALHLADHVVLPERNASPYPFTDDGAFPLPADSDLYEALTACTWVAAHTSSIDVGTSVLVLPQRHPLEVAKIAASISRLTDGRFFLGVGAGWLREEFDALGRDFDSRGKAMDESLEILRSAWQGMPSEFAGEVWEIPEGIHCRPLPDHLPLLIGGMSSRALRRAAVHDGWIAHVSAHDDLRELGTKMEKLRELREIHNQQGSFRAVAKLAHYDESMGTTRPLQELVNMGFDEIVIYPGWNDLDASAHLISGCRSSIDAS